MLKQQKIKPTIKVKYVNEYRKLIIDNTLKYFLELQNTENYNISITELQNRFGCSYNTAVLLIRFFINNGVLIQQHDGFKIKNIQQYQINRLKHWKR